MTENRNQVSGLSFVGTLFTGDCRFDRAAFVNVNMQGAQFDDVNMHGVRISNVNLSDTVLTDVNVDGMTINGIPVKDALDAFASGGRRFSQQHNALLPQIYRAKTPKEAAQLIAQYYSAIEAVDIIDSLDPITAALVIEEFRRRQKRPGGSLSVAAIKQYADCVIELAEQKKIRGVEGVFHARNQVFRETGYFTQTQT